MEELELRKGGILICTDGRVGKRKWKRDVTATAPAYLFRRCRLAKNVTLRDVFLLLRKHEKLFTAVLRNWCAEYTAEALATKGDPYTKRYSADGIEYLKLQKWLSVWSFPKKQWASADDITHFGGVGFALRRASKELGVPKGYRMSWGVDFTPVHQLANIPLRLDDEYIVTVEGGDDPKTNQEHRYLGATFTMGEILHGILWELSFHGSPKDRDARSAELDKTVEEYRSRKAKLVKAHPGTAKRRKGAR